MLSEPGSGGKVCEPIDSVRAEADFLVKEQKDRREFWVCLLG
jgi:hypothetical protein